MKRGLFFTFVFLFFPLFTSAYFDLPKIQKRSVWENVHIDTSKYFYRQEQKKHIHIPQKTIEKFKKENSLNIPEYFKVTRIIIHDTGCCNQYTDPLTTIQRINKDHSITRGWEDIGYNYIIDKKGNIYEGRKGGNGKKGAHAYDNRLCRNFNVGSVGIALIGDFDRQKPTQEALNSLYKLVGWLSAANGIDPEKMDLKTPVWTNPKYKGECISEYGGSFSQVFVGPSVLGHKDIEKDNDDPGVLNMNILRKEANKWKQRYENLVYQKENEFFILKDGFKVPVFSPKIFLEATDFIYNAFPYKRHNNLKNGALIKEKNAPQIYKIENGKKRHITSYLAFKKMGYSMSDVLVLSKREVEEYKTGDPLDYDIKNENILIKKEGDYKIYLLQQGKARWIKTYNTFKKLGFSMSDVIEIPKTDFKKYPKGKIIF